MDEVFFVFIKGGTIVLLFKSAIGRGVYFSYMPLNVRIITVVTYFIPVETYYGIAKMF